MISVHNKRKRDEPTGPKIFPRTPNDEFLTKITRSLAKNDANREDYHWVKNHIASQLKEVKDYVDDHPPEFRNHASVRQYKDTMHRFILDDEIQNHALGKKLKREGHEDMILFANHMINNDLNKARHRNALAIATTERPQKQHKTEGGRIRKRKWKKKKK